MPEFLRRNAGYIVSVAFVVLLVAVGFFGARALLPNQAIETDLPEETAEMEEQVGAYDWTNLDRTDGRYRYLVNGEVKSRLGIDVSESQHEIDWQAVADDGIEFALIRLGYRGATAGELYVDEQYWANIEGASAVGIDYGVYFFSQANTVEEAVDEAEFVIENLGGMDLAYPVAFDSEVVNLKGETSPTADLTTDEMTAIANAFCSRVEEAGYDALLYGNQHDLSRYHTDTLTANSIWWAEHNTPVPGTLMDFRIWQYSNSGSVAGISTNVDMNIDLRDATQ